MKSLTILRKHSFRRSKWVKGWSSIDSNNTCSEDFASPPCVLWPLLHNSLSPSPGLQGISFPVSPCCNSSPLTHFYYILTSHQHFLQCPTTFQIFLRSLISLLQITFFLSSLFCLQLPAEQEAACLVRDSVLHLCLLTAQCLFSSCRRQNICACTAVCCHWWVGIDLVFLPLRSSCFPWNKKHLVSLRHSWLELAKASKNERELNSWRAKMPEATLFRNPG